MPRKPSSDSGLEHDEFSSGSCSSDWSDAAENQSSPSLTEVISPADRLKTSGTISHFDHVTFWVGNAKQAAAYYVMRLGFSMLAYRGLETGSRTVASHVIRNGDTIFMFQSALLPGNEKMGNHLRDHGDGVRDVAFTVDNCDLIFKSAVEKGARVIAAPHIESDDDGTVTLATVQTFGDTTHTFVERHDYAGRFLPGYTYVAPDRLEKILPRIDLEVIDHVVCNQDWEEMEAVCEWYERNLSFRRFWSGYDRKTHTEFTSMHTVVLTNEAETIKLGITEPAKGRKKSQIEEYVTYYGGAGCQHIALRTPDIIKTVSRMEERGVRFLPIPTSYYDDLRERLQDSKVKIIESLSEIERLNILVDFDDNGYLLQLFTSPLQDRPTVFVEIIQRCGHSGFGAGNFKSLFQAIELEQSRRGTF